MTTLLDVSRKLDQVSIDLLLAVDSTAATLGVTYCIIGAFARDVILGLCFGIDTGEATRDIDFGLMMDDWAQFDEVRARLIAHKEFAEHGGTESMQLCLTKQTSISTQLARVLGRDLAGIAGRDTRARLEQILEHGTDRRRGEPLLRSLSLRYEEARRLLEA